MGVDDFPDPIIILGSPRSGTSLIASIFAAHGVFVGTSREPDEANPRGYYENAILSELRYRMGHGDGLDKRSVYDCLIADGYSGGPWLVKHSPPTWRAWRQFNPTWILVRRTIESIVISRRRCGQWDMTEAEHRIAVDTDLATMNGIQRYIGAYSIWPQTIVHGKLTTLKDVFEKCGIRFDEEAALSCVDSNLWHN